MRQAPPPRMRQVGALADLLVRIAFWIAAAALVVILAITLVEITMRYVFGAPTMWVSDSVRYLLAYLIMLGLPEVTRSREHVSITLVLDAVPSGHWYRRALLLVSAAACAAVVYFAIDVAMTQVARNTFTQGTWRIPRVWITGAVAAGFAVAGLVFLAQGLAPRRLPQAKPQAAPKRVEA
ncbi:TRAP transporter small permease [Frigidibacter sp. MR17.24]|uniref:TRAP transporter small permease n=1 Tax=Frigidibacter sp. MR17.24 TaxID=3127345 RepID=UPI003012CC6A